MADLYAIVGTMPRARFMLAAHVPFLQLRFKEKPLAPHREEIAEWAAEFPSTRLIINDDLDFAQAVGAWGAHLGQEDLDRYPEDALHGAGLALGISTHSDEEIARAKRYNPAMLGFGPMFPTTTKQTKRAPQGVTRLRELVAREPLPLVAIGGINDANMGEVAATGVAMVAMIAHLDQCRTVDDIRAVQTALAR